MQAESEPEELLPSAPDDAESRRKAAASAIYSFHPGNTLKDGRYRPFRKLGKGQFSTVWLARDTQESRYVAIKAGHTWREKAQLYEISIMKHLIEHPIAGHPGNDHVFELLDDFLYAGPHGSHVCLVTKPMG